MKTLIISKKSDLIGAAVSGLCLVHCLATPFLFAAQAGLLHGAESHPQWWGALDLIFLGIAFLAIVWSAKNTSKQWIGMALWVCWALLALVVINEKTGFFKLAEWIIYIPALSLIFLHSYNRKFCQCNTTGCCAD